jgi:hypothetical protein
MQVIFEGLDRCGKDTQITKFINNNKDKIFHTLKYSSLPFKDSEEYSLKLYKKLFELLLSTDYNFICNRAHLGETVYAPIYRGYNSSEEIFNYEKIYLSDINDIFLIVFVDEAQNLFLRDDGLGLSTSIEDIEEEKLAFELAFERSSIKNKLLINIDKKSPHDVEVMINNFINGQQNSSNL